MPGGGGGDGEFGWLLGMEGVVHSVGVLGEVNVGPLRSKVTAGAPGHPHIGPCAFSKRAALPCHCRSSRLGPTANCNHTPSFTSDPLLPLRSCESESTFALPYASPSSLSTWPTPLLQHLRSRPTAKARRPFLHPNQQANLLLLLRRLRRFLPTRSPYMTGRSGSGVSKPRIGTQIASELSRHQLMN